MVCGNDGGVWYRVWRVLKWQIIVFIVVVIVVPVSGDMLVCGGFVWLLGCASV